MEIAKLNINNKTVTIRNRDKPWMHNEIRNKYVYVKEFTELHKE